MATRPDAPSGPRFDDSRDHVQSLTRGLAVLQAFDAERPTRPAGFMSVMTLGYAAGAGLLWAAGMGGLVTFVGAAGTGPAWLLIPAALIWTAAIALYLLWTFLARPDERRFDAVLGEAYRRPAPTAASASVSASPSSGDET